MKEKTKGRNVLCQVLEDITAEVRAVPEVTAVPVATVDPEVMADPVVPAASEGDGPLWEAVTVGAIWAVGDTALHPPAEEAAAVTIKRRHPVRWVPFAVGEPNTTGSILV